MTGYGGAAVFRKTADGTEDRRIALAKEDKTQDTDMPDPAEKQPERRLSSIIFFIVLVLLYIVSNIYASIVVRSQEVIGFRDMEVPVSTFTGVFSSLANMCVIFMAVFFGRFGFFTGLITLCAQFPVLVNSIVKQHGISALPGLFTNVLTIVAVILIYRRNRQIDDYRSAEMMHLKERQRLSHRLFEQTATALVNAIDAKDTYSHGHSIRVAEYSRMIAEKMGKDPEECEQIYYAALLHDVGKIGIDDRIINKKGKLTEDEYEVIRTHPATGNQILSGISEYPYLSIGAQSHHERYDGKGYPEGLKGEDIPEIARIISVADAYDAMSSNRSYREAIPQHLIREEIVKGEGTQFDPGIAKIMQILIDNDPEYRMKEENAVRELGGRNGLVCHSYRNEISDGIVVTQYPVRIRMTCRAEEQEAKAGCPALILFDSLDGRYHEEERTARDLQYYEYCEIRFDGSTDDSGVRKIRSSSVRKEDGQNASADTACEVSYDIEAVKYKDHVRIRLDDGKQIREVTAALPDSSRYVYIGLTGEHCTIGDVTISRSDTPVGENEITRIAEEISYIDGSEGDIPNVQVDGVRTASSEGVPVTDGLKISFHTKSLPTARLVWHCPYIVLYSAHDNKVDGKHYREYALIRLDGEDCPDSRYSENRVVVNKNVEFENWDAWKRSQKNGADCTVSFEREGRKIVTTTQILGLAIRCITTIKDGNEDIFAALTGDQCAITDIRIRP